ncbi:nuclear fragile x mental retardation-interacting 1, partial [Fusarium albosuccineum]
AQYPPYPGPPPPPGPPHQDGYYGHNRRGRGGFRDGNSRGRGGYHGNDKSRHHKPGHNDANHNKPETPTLGKKKKRKMNTLGLTPGMDSESEDDEGEEKILTDLIGQETLHVKDIASFLADRKKHFPTKARVEAKKAAELAQNGEDKASSLEKQADKLRRQLRKVESSIKRKREQGDEGDEMRDPSEESSDDEPEVMSTRSHVAPPPPPPPAKKADVSKHCKYYSTGGTCGKKGKCRFVHDPEVREAAMKEREANNGRLTIQQRLILNDKEQEDLTVLQSIQYLREKGLMKPADPSEENKESRPEPKQQKADLPALPPQSSLLPAASASLPPPPIKREPALPRRNPPPSILPGANSNSTQGIKPYEGWLLRPYGSSSGKSSKSDDLP